MSTRIRYSKTAETGILQSVKIYTHEKNGARFKVRLDENQKLFQVIEDTSGVIEAEGAAVNMHQVKIKAKKALERLGISFGSEARSNKEEQTA